MADDTRSKPSGSRDYLRQRTRQAPRVFTHARPMTDSWTMRELRQVLGDFEDDLRAAGLSENTVTTYVDRADRFLRYLSGDYRPGR